MSRLHCKVRGINFCIPGRSYIYCDTNGQDGTLGVQPTDPIPGSGGNSTLCYSGNDPAEFRRVCEAWCRRHGIRRTYRDAAVMQGDSRGRAYIRSRSDDLQTLRQRMDRAGGWYQIVSGLFTRADRWEWADWADKHRVTEEARKA